MVVRLCRTILGTMVIPGLMMAAPARATVYNVFVFGDYTGHNADVEGALAAGGNVTLADYAVADRLTSAVDKEDTLVAGGTLTMHDGQLFHGNAVAGAYAGNLKVANGAQITGPSPIDFDAAKAQYQGYANDLAATASNGTATSLYGTLTLTGLLGGLNVFDVDGATIDALDDFHLSIPDNAYALINVTGASAAFTSMGFDIGTTPYANVLFNLADATSLKLEAIGFEGSVLAPNADVTFDNGQFNGQLIAKSNAGTGEFHDHPLDSAAFFKDPQTPTSAVPEPASWAMMLLGVGTLGFVLRRRRSQTGAPLAA